MVKKRIKKIKKALGQSLLLPLAVTLASQGAVASDQLPELKSKTKSSRAKSDSEEDDLDSSSGSLTDRPSESGVLSTKIPGLFQNVEFFKTARASLAQTVLTSPQVHGFINLVNSGVDGRGASMIVLDQGAFEPDLHTNFSDVSPIFGHRGRQIAHGTLVAASAASMNPDSPGLASGALVFPMSTSTPETGENLRALRNELDVLSQASHQALETYWAESHKLLDSYNEHLASYQTHLKNNDVEAMNADVAAMEDVNARIVTHEAQGDEIEADFRQRWEALRLKMDQFRAMPINHQCLDELERTLSYCEANQIAKPRVINMSLAFYAKDAEMATLVPRLQKLLHDHDMLLVASIGNEGGRVIRPENELALKGKLYENVTDIRDHINDFPELAERLLLVGALNMMEDKREEYSTRPGVAKDHAIMSMINPVTTIVGEDQEIRKSEGGINGTSFAAPQVAAMAVVLGKYFPKLSMTDIKDIVLKSAYRPGNIYDAETFGQGCLDPLQAWISALEHIKGGDVGLEQVPESPLVKVVERGVQLRTTMDDTLADFADLEDKFADIIGKLEKRTE